MEFATSTVMGERVVEILGRYAPREATTRPERMVLPDLRVPGYYATATCKHECVVLKQSRHIRQAHAVWTEWSAKQRALMLSISGQCGLDTTRATHTEIHVVATYDGPL